MSQINERFTNKHGISEVIALWLSSDDYDYEPNTISTTTLIDAPIRRLLMQKHKHEIKEDVSERLWAGLGTAIHHVIEKLAPIDKYVTEERHRTEITIHDKTYILTGKIDLYNKESKFIEDVKVTTKYTFMDQPYKVEWEYQQNVYAYLLRKKGIPVEGLRISAIIRDYMQKDRFDERMPRRSTIDIELPLWSFEDQEAYIMQRLERHYTVEKAFETDYQLVCLPEERWESPTTFAAIKPPNVRATKVFTDLAEAHDWARGQKGAFDIVTRPGQAKRCLEYCSLQRFCEYGKQLTV